MRLLQSCNQLDAINDLSVNEETYLFFFGTASAAWLADDWSETGVYGDATKGTAEKGEILLETAVQNLTKLFTVISTFETAQGEQHDQN